MQGGCDYQFASNWVIGIGGDFAWTKINGTVNDPFFQGKNGGPIPINTLFQGFPKTDGNRCAANNDGDPIIYYDQLADRWVISQFDVTRPSGATADYQCLAVSTSGDPTGTYYRWDYQIPGGMMGDYEKIGLWPDGYYMTIRAFNTAGAFQGSKCLIFDRSKLLVGAPDATQLDTGYLCTNAVQATPCTALRTQDGFTPMSLDGFNPPPAAAADAVAKYSGGNAIRFYWLKVNSNSDGSWAATPEAHRASSGRRTRNRSS